MNLIIICGPPASGKMTVGQALQEVTGYKLFHNHLSLELVNQFFDFGTTHFSHLDKKLRFAIFEEIAKSEITGLIFTIVWDFNEKDDEDYIDQVVQVFKNRNPKVGIVELNCDLEERLKRNKTENRLKHKPSKRDIDFSTKLLLTEHKLYRTTSEEGEFLEKKILKINNTHKSAKKVAEMIVSHYSL